MLRFRRAVQSHESGGLRGCLCGKGQCQQRKPLPLRKWFFRCLADEPLRVLEPCHSSATSANGGCRSTEGLPEIVSRLGGVTDGIMVQTWTIPNRRRNRHGYTFSQNRVTLTRQPKEPWENSARCGIRLHWNVMSRSLATPGGGQPNFKGVRAASMKPKLQNQLNPRRQQEQSKDCT